VALAAGRPADPPFEGMWWLLRCRSGRAGAGLGQEQFAAVAVDAMGSSK
jgi:hypothetical protein